jgi:hypothetical protein
VQSKVAHSRSDVLSTVDRMMRHEWKPSRLQLKALAAARGRAAQLEGESSSDDENDREEQRR